MPLFLSDFDIILYSIAALPMKYMLHDFISFADVVHKCSPMLWTRAIPLFSNLHYFGESFRVRTLLLASSCSLLLLLSSLSLSLYSPFLGISQASKGSSMQQQQQPQFRSSIKHQLGRKWSGHFWPLAEATSVWEKNEKKTLWEEKKKQANRLIIYGTAAAAATTFWCLGNA